MHLNVLVMLVYINMYIAKIMQSKQKIPLIRQGA